jgi:small-conductance mechanosensitive channel
MGGCSAIKGNGERCRGIAATGSDYCPAHDPDRAEERKRAASKAARARHDPEIREIKEGLKDLYAAVLEGRVERAAAAVANQVANTRLRALEVERRIREQDELEGHLEELEAMLADAERRRTHVSRR